LRLITWLLALLLAMFAVNATAADVSRIGVRTGEHADHSRIVFDWTGPVGVKIEQPESGQIILVFDRPADFDLSKARVDKLSRVASIEPVAGRPAMRIVLRGAHGYKLMDVEYKIVVDVVDDTAETPSAKQAISKKTTKTNKQEQAPYSQSDTAASSPKDAAAVGPTKNDAVLSVQPLRVTTPAVADPKDTPAASAQPAPATTAAAEQPKRSPADAAGIARANPTGPIPSPLLNPAAWQGGKPFATVRTKLAELLAADPMNTDNLLKIAQFLFAWRHADEALSTLAGLRMRDPKLAARYDAMLLEDAARLLTGRPGVAAGVFAISALREKPESRLWQGAAAALAGHADEALRAFDIGKPALVAYPPQFRSFLGLLAMEAAIDAGALDAARSYATIIADSHPERDEAAMLEALTGLLLTKEENGDAARPHLLAAARSPAMKPQIMARLALIGLDRADGELTHEAALSALQQLYYGWEGDRLQLDILEKLTALLVEQKRYDDAFDAIAGAKQRFPHDPRMERMDANARELFRDLMIGTAASALDPIEAVALYDEHPELMPSGAAANTITRGLADRLAGLDLIEPAARLYDEALQAAPPVERAEIGAKLAELRLAAGDDAGAVKALDDTYADGLPPAIQARRADIRATALTRSGNQMAALAALGGDNAAADAGTRADLFWRDSNWDLAARDYLRAAESQPEGEAAAARKARLILRATAALLLADKRAEVAAVRERYGPALSKSAVAAVFDKITGPDAGIEVLALPEVSAEIVRID
jgi:hypothetical protein